MNKIYKPDGYTPEDQRSDRAFLAGVACGRNLGLKIGTERVLAAVEALHQPFECCNARCEGGGLHCSVCNEGGNGDIVHHPCPTLTAARAAVTGGGQ